MIYLTMIEVSMIRDAEHGLKKLIYLQIMIKQMIGKVSKIKLIGQILT